MGGIDIDVLPRDAELARRAAGGDGTAFVWLYDQYSADVFEAALTTTRSVETAAEATQAAFLNLLRRPPAIDAPDNDVLERLTTMALDAPLARGTSGGAGVGWLRSETVAKAAGRFDADWSGQLVGATASGRTTAEVALGWQDTERVPAAGVVTPERPESEPEVEPAPRAARRRRFRLRTLLPVRPLPSPAALAAVPAIGAVAATLAVLAAGGRDGAGERTETLASVDAARLAPLSAIGGGERRQPRRPRAKAAPSPVPARADAHAAAAPPAPTYPRPGGSTRSVAADRPAAGGGTLGVRRGLAVPRDEALAAPRRPAPVEGTPPRAPAPAPQPPAVRTEAAPAPSPAPAPAPAPVSAAPAPGEPQSPNGGGVRRNCNSKQSTSPC